MSNIRVEDRTKTTFKRDFLMEELDLPSAALETKLVDTTRWTTVHEIIFEHEGKHYKTWYRRSATVLKDEEPWEYEDEVICYNVKKKLIQVESWEYIPADSHFL